VLTLVSMPVTVTRPEEGTAFVVPPGFMRISNYRMPGVSTPLFNESTGEFSEKVPSSTKSLIRFSLPPELLPVHIDKWIVTVSVSAPDRKVRLFMLKAGGTKARDFKDLLQADGPIALLSAEVSGDADAQLDSQGSVVFGIDVGASTDPMSIWQFKSMSVTAEGHIEKQNP
jgi:hypothetical protein